MEKRSEFNDQIKMIFLGGKVRKIQWGDEFEAWDLQHQLDYAKELASAMNQAADLLQQERDVLRAKLSIAKASAESAQQALDIQKGIARKTILDTNLEKQELFSRIESLRRELRKAKAE